MRALASEVQLAAFMKLVSSQELGSRSHGGRFFSSGLWRRRAHAEQSEKQPENDETKPEETIRPKDQPNVDGRQEEQE